ncbi:MAG: hypothetical protein J5I91_08210 [Bacteroidetes bacterium]|nr:hypothetical protein [Bacteroidota bacterium]
MKKLIIISFLVLSSLGKLQAAHEQSYPITFSIFNNGTMLPGSGYAGVFSKTIHPGFTIGTSYDYVIKEKSRLFQTFKFGYFYHRFSQNAVQLYSELGYQHKIYSALYAQSLLGIGYLHSFADLQQFELEDGEYHQVGKFGRPQFMSTFSLLLGYDFSHSCHFPMEFFLQYQFWLQMPFVNKYVPILPNSALHLGARFSIFNTSNK